MFLQGCNKTLSTSPPDPDPPQSNLSINSIPEGYQIYLDGKISGETTPHIFKFMEEKEYLVNLKHYLYLDTTITMSLNGRENNYFLDVEGSKYFLGKIICRSYPMGADILFDDSLTNQKTPAVLENIYPGFHKVKYELLGHRAAEKFITVFSNDSTICSASLIDTTV